MWEELLRALALLLVLEGILPFLTPAGCKRYFYQVLQMPNRSLRVLGFSLMVVGAVMLYFV